MKKHYFMDLEGGQIIDITPEEEELIEYCNKSNIYDCSNGKCKYQDRCVAFYDKHCLTPEEGILVEKI